MTSPAYGFAKYLETAGFGTVGANTGWSINVAAEPASPDTTITVYDTSGLEPDTEQMDRRPTFQIRGRGPDYLAVYTKVSNILSHLVARNSLETQGTKYIGIVATSDIMSLGRDDNNRYVLTANFRVASTGGAA